MSSVFATITTNSNRMSSAVDSPEGGLGDKPSSPGQGDDAAAGPSVAKAVTPSAEDDEDEDDLFGAGDGEEDDEEDAIKRPTRQRRKVASQSPSAAATPSDRPAALSRNISTPPAANSEEYDEQRDRLEFRETNDDRGMGYRDGQAEAVELQEAAFALPSLPVRRGAAHFFARLPNLLQYRAEAFDEAAFDETLEDEQLQSREGIRIDDAGLRSLLTTTNTIRWRWSGKRDADGVRVPESNARIVRWDDGSSSLQLGSEFYDITTTTERVQGQAQSASTSQSQTEPTTTTKSLVPPQPVQHLTHLFVKHNGQDEVNMLQAEAPVMGSLTFRPTSIASESHQRLAKAVRQQRGTLVKETSKNEDPEMEKERQEREEKKRKQIRMREQRKRRKGREDEDDDAFWASAGRAVRRAGGAGLDAPVAPAATGRSGAAGAYNDDDDDVEADDDGFVVDDDDEDDGEESGRAGRRSGAGEDSEMDVDEPDELDRLEAEAEKTNARELASKAASSDDKKVEAAAGDAAAGEGVQAGRRRRVIESDDEE